MKLNVILLVTTLLLAYAQAQTSDKRSLVIYACKSFFQNPTPWDWVGSFAASVGLKPSDIKVQLFNNSNDMLTGALNWTGLNLPPPDVLAGVDQVLQLSVPTTLLEPYNSPSISRVKPWLLKWLNMSSAAPLAPFDFSITSLVADLRDFKSHDLSLLNSTNFDYDTLRHEPKFMSHWITEDPSTSPTGLGFLLSTIAMYGDPKLKISGIVGKDGDWRKFWRASNKFKVTSYREEAFGAFVANKFSIVTSHTTDLLYDNCINKRLSYAPLVPKVNGWRYGWLEVEGVGITKIAAQNSTRLAYAQKFVDWLLNETAQSQIPMTQWNYPATDVALPACFQKTFAPDPTKLRYANTFLTPQQIKTNQAGWIKEWKAIVNSVPSHSLSLVLAISMLFAMCLLF